MSALKELEAYGAAPAPAAEAAPTAPSSALDELKAYQPATEALETYTPSPAPAGDAPLGSIASILQGGLTQDHSVPGVSAAIRGADNNITSSLMRLLGAEAGMGTVGAHVIADMAQVMPGGEDLAIRIRASVDAAKEGENKTTAESVVSFVGALADPTTYVGAGLGANLLKRVAAPWIRAKKLKEAKAAISEPMRIYEAQRKARIAEHVAEGVGASGAVGFGGSAIHQLDETGTVDPTRTMLEGAASTALGAGVGKAVGRATAPTKARVLKQEVQRKNLTVLKDKLEKAGAIMEGTAKGEGHRVKFTEGVTRKTLLSRSQHLSHVEGKLADKRLALQQLPAGPSKQRSDLRIELKKLEREYKKAVQKFEESFTSSDYQAVMRLKEAFGGAKRTIRTADGREVRQPIWKLGIGEDGTVLLPSQVRTLLNLKNDIPFRWSGSWTGVDMIRAVESLEGQKGFLYRQMILPVIKAESRLLFEEKAVLETALPLFKAAGLTTRRMMATNPLGQAKSRAVSSRIARAIERNKLDTLAPAERKVAKFMRQHYDEWLDRVNAVRVGAGIEPIPKLPNYIPHIHEMSIMSKMGLDLSTIPVKDITKVTHSPSFKHAYKRYQKEYADPFIVDSFFSYQRAAFRAIHFTEPGKQAQAMAAFMPENMARMTRRWVSEKLFGGLEGTDHHLIESAFGNAAMSVMNKASNLVGSRYIMGSANVAVQQFGHPILTALSAGTFNMLRSLPKVRNNVPERLMNMSTMLPSRSLSRHLDLDHRIAFSKFEKFKAAITEFGDRAAFQQSWWAGFQQGKQLGLSDAGAVALADDVGRWIHASYSPLFKPTLISGVAKGSNLKFQTFSLNLWNFLTKDTKLLSQIKGTSQRWEVAKYLTAMMASDLLFEGAGLPQPYRTLQHLPAGFDEMGELRPRFPSLVPDMGLAGAIGSLGNVPATQIPEDVGKVIKTLIHANGNYWMDEDLNAQFYEAARGLGANFVTAGEQLKRTYEGINAVLDGYTKIGREAVDIDGWDEKARAVLFGPQNIKAIKQKRKERELLKFD